MSEAADNAIEQLEDQLEGAERTLSALSSLSDQQAQRVAQRMDRLASQLLEISAPPAINDVHNRLGTQPVEPDEFASLTDRLGAADGEG
ncbi:MAG: hypothetical protein WKF42_06905 [Solirubrobacteraceae bacterium]